MNLPLIDGCLILDNSALSVLQACPYEFETALVKKRVSSAGKAGANFGSACHIALKARYDIYGNQPCIDPSAILPLVDEHFILSPEPVGDHRNFNMVSEWLAAYNRMYKKEPFDILKLHDGRCFVEKSFLRPFAFINQSGQLVSFIPFFAYLKEFTTQEFVAYCKERGWIPVLYSGRIDLGISDNGEWVLDHKTAYQFGKHFQMEMASTPQMRGYCWEFKHYFGRLPKGYIINAMRVRPPVKQAEYDPSLLFRTAGSDPDFIRLPFTVTEQDITEWEQNTFALIEELLWCAQRPHYPKHKKNCVGKYGACQFYELCNNVDLLHRDSYLASPVFMPNNWSALNKPETAKEE